MEYSLEAFIDTLLIEKGTDGLSEEVKAQLRTDLMDRVENYINAELVAAIPPDSFGRLESVIDGGKDEEIQSFFQEQIPNLDEMIANNLIAFRGLYINGSVE